MITRFVDKIVRRRVQWSPVPGALQSVEQIPEIGWVGIVSILRR